ncbi:alcohol acetyltransferase-domain-containing protein [Podospora aff. communis PSN243]|uniref:Alcohol acetyltransferase-domain-containing protein n=1 Tax=Podospora aff. communis PSN243 TaxID=3040156 RepID=A0AAV9GK86_9PEZI|nr:alcohol acetyltransferase-domain-containing protein [Podospora aff. communis PSN243]
MEANAAMKPERVIRPLGRLESYHSMLHNLGYLYGVVVSCQYAIPNKFAHDSGLSQLKETFEMAVAQTVLDHPMLRVGLVGEGSKQPAWVELQRVDLGWHMQWRDGKSHLLQDIIPSQLDARFGDLETRPGWRLVALHNLPSRQLDVVFAFNHANFDGISGKIFHESLLRNLNVTKTGDKLEALNHSTHILSLPAVDQTTFPAPQEHTAPYTVSPHYLLSNAWQELRPSLPLLVPKPTTQATWAPIRTHPFATRVQTFSISATDGTLPRLLAACRAHHTTLTGLLNAIILVSLATELDTNSAPAFTGGTALNMRRFSSASPSPFPSPSSTPSPSSPKFDPNKTITNSVSDIKHPFNASETANLRRLLQKRSPGAPHWGDATLRDTIWSIAARVRAEIQAKLDAGTRDDSIGLMRFVGDWRRTVIGQTRKGRSVAWNLSNVGVLGGDILDGGGGGLSGGGGEDLDGVWECERAEFVLGGEVTGAAFNVGVISVRGKGLDVAVSWQDCAVDEVLGGRVVGHMEGLMKELSQL